MDAERKRMLYRKNLGLLSFAFVMLVILLPTGIWVQNRFGKFAFYMVLVFGMGLLFKPVYNFFARKFGYETVEEYMAKKK